MNQNINMILAIVGGVFLAMQGGFNAQLGVQLRNPLMASLVAFFFSMVFALLMVLMSLKNFPKVSLLYDIPKYLWFTGALFSVFGIYLYYYTIPKLGMSTMISLGLFGQLLFSAIAGHYGWFGMPQEPMEFKRILGVAAMFIGIFLIKEN
ncbi:MULTISPECIES: DMT family transporter [Maribacter]|uniref:DMT family transporter n=1 Tax=Maribacter flavus TaxID=1658664 RepID=A0ABU7IGU8_9FLAO|nr:MULTISPECIES: DMT family transporter [Maribacter]MDC6404657.1 DMT family transporter [Maribacter sp. PR66]MEE1972071.1 DMT family transporter [Maribacter flavus]